MAATSAMGTAPDAAALEAALKAAGVAQHTSNGPQYRWVQVGDSPVQVWFATSAADHPLREALGAWPTFVVAGGAGAAAREDAEMCTQLMALRTAGTSMAQRAALIQSEAGEDGGRQLLASPILVPLSGDAARSLLSTYMTASAGIKRAQMPAVVAFCRGMDERPTFLGAIHSKAAATTDDLARNRLQASAPGASSLSQMTYTSLEISLTSERIAPSGSALKQALAAHFDMDRMVRRLSSATLTNALIAREQAIDITATTRFDVVGSYFPKLDIPLSSSVSLISTWTAHDTAVFGAPPASAHVVLSTRCLPYSGDPLNNPLAKALSGELDFLRFLDLVRSGLEAWDASEPALSLALSVDALLKAASAPAAAADANEGSQTRDDGEEAGGADWASASLPQRSDVDFTEHIWRFCLSARGKDDVADVLAKVFALVDKGTVQPFVHKTNRSALASVIRDAVKVARLTAVDAQQQKAQVAEAMDRLIGRPVEALMEVGLVKLRRDYAHHLGGFGVFEVEPAYFVDDSAALEEQLRRLRQLHRLFELWAFFKFNVPAIGSDIVRAVLLQAAQQTATGAVPSDEPMAVSVALPRFTGSTTAAVAAMTRNQEPAVVQLLLSDEHEPSRAHLLRLARGEDPLFAVAVERDPDAYDVEDPAITSTYAVSVGRRSTKTWLE